jgi:hypothetical protein
MGENKHLKDEKETIVINNTSNVIGWLEKFLVLLKEYGPFKIIVSTILIAFISIFFYFIFNPTKIFEVYDEWKLRQHTALMELRMDMAPKIQTVLDKLTYKVGASRSLVLEMHNGSTGNGGLPFTKCTATYEGLNINVYPVAGQYQEQNLSLIPFATHLFKQGYWCGDTEELLAIDRGLYYKMKSNETEHFAACVIEGVDQALAFMIVSFDELPNTQHDCEAVRDYIRHAAMEIAVLLEVGYRMEDFKKYGKF